MAVVDGEQRLQPGDPRLHSVMRMALVETPLEDGGAAPCLLPHKHHGKDSLGSGSGILGGRWERLLGCWDVELCLLSCWWLLWLPVSVLPAQSSLQCGRVSGKGKGPSPPFLCWGWVGRTCIVSQSHQWQFSFSTGMKTGAAPTLQGFTARYFPLLSWFTTSFSALPRALHCRDRSVCQQQDCPFFTGDSFAWD